MTKSILEGNHNKSVFEDEVVVRCKVGFLESFGVGIHLVGEVVQRERSDHVDRPAGRGRGRLEEGARESEEGRKNMLPQTSLRFGHLRRGRSDRSLGRLFPSSRGLGKHFFHVPKPPRRDSC